MLEARATVGKPMKTAAWKKDNSFGVFERLYKNENFKEPNHVRRATSHHTRAHAHARASWGGTARRVYRI